MLFRPREQSAVAAGGNDVQRYTKCSLGEPGDVMQHGRHVLNKVDFFAFDATIPATQRTATVRCGISAGPWKDGAETVLSEGEITERTRGEA